MIIGRKAKNYKQRIKIGNNKLVWKSELKYLGVYIDRMLKFQKQVTTSRGKAIGAFWKLFPLIKYLPPEEGTILYKVYIRPILEYGLQITNNAPTINKLDSLQNRLIRIVAGKPEHTSNEQIRQRLNIENFEIRRTRIASELT